MAGIYIHIPFCKQACNYCNFHFSTSLKHKEELVTALTQEIRNRNAYLAQELETVYLGGGTPSLLAARELQKIFTEIRKSFAFEQLRECTLEANPDDINPQFLEQLKSTPVDRLSIGIQSFREADLKFMNRAHNAREAINAVSLAQQAGYKNITIDLIYGTPGLSNKDWQENLERAIDLGVQHISSYALTVEEKTVLAHQIEKGKTPEPKSEQAAEQFEILVATLCSSGFEHYEISNFAQPGHYAIHNTNYWKGAHYLGIGPSAHSFNGQSRQWNVANNALYCKGIFAGDPVHEVEILSRKDQINEMLLTGLRTMWGVDLAMFREKFGDAALAGLISKLEQENPLHYSRTAQQLKLTEAGKLFADGIAANLFED
ncbi:MAG: radical SAM family heme chaperone HemW [Sphingobacteriales bacterium]|nr:MAG: radical SAM family heme chaperone HemW [Sphingobacteriales bacterium]